jgi:hypothetical protein
MKFLISLALAALALPAFANTAEQAWRFRVYLDDKEIGYHEFRVREQDGVRRLETEASFEYKLLFLTLYEYEHENTEIWKGDCLAEIQSYWNPAFLEQDRLLNSQNGEFVDIEVGAPERVDLEVRGTVLPALRYRIEGEDLGIELYYSESQEWLALEADAAGGRKLRYELI